MIKFDNTIKRDEYGRVMMPISYTFIEVGRGIEAGRPTVFVGLKCCNSLCKTGDKTCNNPEAHLLQAEETIYKTAKEIAEEVVEAKSQRVCITGEEPLAREGIAEFIKDLCELLPNKIIEIETNGSIDIFRTFNYIEPAKNVRFICNYLVKPNEEKHKMITKNWNLLDENDCIKFVVSSKEDMDCAIDLIKRYTPVAQVMFHPILDEIGYHSVLTYICSEDVINLDIKIQFE